MTLNHGILAIYHTPLTLTAYLYYIYAINVVLYIYHKYESLKITFPKDRNRDINNNVLEIFWHLRSDQTNGRTRSISFGNDPTSFGKYSTGQEVRRSGL
jgi:hypothetical protein